MRGGETNISLLNKDKEHHGDPYMYLTVRSLATFLTTLGKADHIAGNLTNGDIGDLHDVGLGYYLKMHG